MARSVLNSFGVRIPRERAKALLQSAGWFSPNTTNPRRWFPFISKTKGWDTSMAYTLRQAWEKFTGVRQ